MTEPMSDQKAKKLAKERDDYECQFCGMTREEHNESIGRDLEAHHIVKDRDGGINHPRNLITVCRSCHRTLEGTQADAISLLRKNILRSVDEHYVRHESLHDVIQDTVNDTMEDMVEKDEPQETDDVPDEPTVVIGEYYNHEDYGRVYTTEIDVEIVGVSPSGPSYDKVVWFQRNEDNRDSQDVCESLDVFLNRIDDLQSQLPTDVAKEVQR